MKKLTSTTIRASWTIMVLLVVSQAALGAQRTIEGKELSNKIAKEMESIMRLRSSGKILNLSDKFSDILTIDFLLRSSDRFRNKTFLEKVKKEARRKDTLTRRKTNLPDLEEAYSSTETISERMLNDAPVGSSVEMYGDDPFAHFSFEQFDKVPSDRAKTSDKSEESKKKRDERLHSKYAEIRKNQRSRLVKKPIEKVVQEYNRRKYIQIHNKFESVRLEVLRNRSVARTNKEITKFSLFVQIYSSVHNGVYLRNVGSCAYLCVESRGKVYTKDSGTESGDCLFNTSLQQEDITDSAKLVSLKHSNSTHKLYLSLGTTGFLEGTWIADESLDRSSVQALEHRRDWILLPVTFPQLSKVFRKKDIPLVSSIWGLQEFYCPKIIKRRERRRFKPRKKSEDCSKLKKGRRRCFLAEEVKMCSEKRKKQKNKSKKSKTETCTQAERDVSFGKGWRWNTRNCESLKPKTEIKKCRKDKLKRCIQKEIKNNSLSESAAKLKCKELSKRKKNRSSRKKKLKSS